MNVVDANWRFRVKIVTIGEMQKFIYAPNDLMFYYLCLRNSKNWIKKQSEVSNCFYLKKKNQIQ